ncbi:MAG: pyrroline-5-carboxylate reductase [Anaerolineae bacterium]|nr:MAG: pyrroline-5-carboxylate reductase [Anaerolineae bacterium]
MFSDKKIAFIGPGVMAEAMIRGLLRQQVAAPEGVLAAGPRRARLEKLQQKYQIAGYTDNRVAARLADVVVLSVKPQRLDEVLSELKGSLRANALVLSIVAGARIEKIATALEHPFVVRAMPNTPAQIAEGITVWTDSPQVDEHQREMAASILGALGEEIYMEDEDYLDMATALSGTGPAYVFLFMEAMVDAGVHLGFPRRIAEKLVAHTLRGSVDYYLQHMDNGSSLHLAHLRNQVTSPAGTSAAALYYLEKAGFRTAISRAIWAAYERSRDLGRGQKTHDPESGAAEA